MPCRTSLFLAAAVLTGALATGCLLDSSAFSTAGTGGSGGPGPGGEGQGATGAGAAGAGAAGAGAGGSGAAGAGGSAEGGSGAGGTEPTGPEECQNGKDDDGDGRTDCADTEDCGEVVTCETAAPEGWEGYFRIRREAHTGRPLSPPACPDGSAPETLYSMPIPEVPCSPCSCEWPEATCSAPKMDCYDNSLICGGGSDFTITATSTGCTAVSSLQSCALTGPPVATNAATCAVSGGEAEPTPAWGEEVFRCGGPAAGGGCSDGAACVPVEAGEYAYLCIQKPGVNNCPDGWTAEQLVVYTGAEDERGCAACECLSPATCGTDGSYTVYDNGSCGGSNKTVTSSTCVNVYSQVAIDGTIRAKLATVIPGTCGGGAPSGELVLQGESTICCRE